MIEVRDVHVSFGGKPVLEGVGLSVPEGGIYALIGPGAAGKSTLMKVIAGLIAPARVGVARATVARPRRLLYDEPTAGLDPVTSQKIYDLIKEEQRAAGTTNLVISSDVAGLLTIADRVGMLHRGRLIWQGTVEEARASEVPEVRQFVHGLVDGPL